MHPPTFILPLPFPLPAFSQTSGVSFGRPAPHCCWYWSFPLSFQRGDAWLPSCPSCSFASRGRRIRSPWMIPPTYSDTCRFHLHTSVCQIRKASISFTNNWVKSISINLVNNTFKNLVQHYKKAVYSHPVSCSVPYFITLKYYPVPPLAKEICLLWERVITRSAMWWRASPLFPSWGCWPS